MQSVYMSRAQIGAHLGLGFKGKRDYYEIFGYARQIRYIEAEAKYTRQGLAARAINAPALALWTAPPEVNFKDSEMQATWNALNHRMLWDTFRQADILAGLGEYSIIIMTYDSDTSIEKYEEPIPAGAKVVSMQAYSQETAHIESFNNVPTSPNFQLPEFYNIKPRQVDNVATAPGVRTESFKVHYSRVVHITDSTLENKVYGIPRILSIWNTLDDLLKVTGGTAETYWITANRGMQIDIDKDVQMDQEEEGDLSDEIEEYQNGLRRVMRTRGVTVKNLGADTPDPKNCFDILVSELSGTTGIPKRILLGSEAGQLASEQDRFNWADRIEERRIASGEPNLLLPFLYRLFPQLTYTNDLFEVNWPPAFQLTPLEQGELDNNLARAAYNNAKAAEVKAKPTETDTDPDDNEEADNLQDTNKE